MYGLVNKAIEQLVVEQFGQDKWVEIRKKAGVETQFASMVTYSDDVTYSLVEAASDVLDTPADDILEAFGQHWITYTVDEGYGSSMSMMGNCVREFLMNLNRLHSQLRVTFSELRPPSISVEDGSDGSLIVHYESERAGLAPMMVGLLKGLGERFSTPVDVCLISDLSEAAGHDVFSVTYIEQEKAA